MKHENDVSCRRDTSCCPNARSLQLNMRDTSLRGRCLAVPANRGAAKLASSLGEIVCASMVYLSPKRLRTKFLDRLGLGVRGGSPPADTLPPPTRTPVPIFATSLSRATEASRIELEQPRTDQLDTADFLNALYRFWCPAVVVRCIEYLNERGLLEEGLYRVPGSSETIKRLRGLYDTYGDVKIESYTPLEGQYDVQVADIASLFKLFLRELPGPIISAEVVKMLENVMEDPLAIRGVLSSNLLPYEFYLLSMFYRHLAAVDARSDINKMDIHNLSIVFCSSSNLGIGSNLFSALAKHSIWHGLRCSNGETALANELPAQQALAETE